MLTNVGRCISAALSVRKYAVNPQFVAVQKWDNSEHRRVALVHLVYDDASSGQWIASRSNNSGLSPALVS